MQTSMFSSEPTITGLDAAVGCGVFHRGEHGVIEAYLPDTYAEPMLAVRFGERLAILKPSELGA